LQHILGEAMVVEWQNNLGVIVVSHCCHLSFML
jgi:hypothetical protein